ncbi:oxidoreductase [Agreia sp. Leaf283]|nr:oxidoreductase [Agreia sp. Leaf283]
MSASLDHPGWPAHEIEALPWQQRARGGTREDRMVRSIDATVPPFIEHLDYTPSLGLISLAESALIAIAQADTDAAGKSVALSRFMIRTESVASSKIERITASAEDYAGAIAGNRSNSSAVSMVAASSALHELVTVVGERGVFSLDDVLDAHRSLMNEDPVEADYAGRLRDMQNWVGGSDYSPRGALHVPPAPERVEPLMRDLLGYLNRDDVPALIQASIAHAQFESIHPFTDGNGRVGRALVSASLRRRGVTRNAVIPLASGILARRDDYFEALGIYRRGDPAPVVELFTRAARVAAQESRTSIDRIKALPGEWIDEVKPRKGSALAALLPVFFDHPVMNADEVERYSGAKTVQTYAAIDRLVEAGVIREITGRKRDRVWVAADLLAELDELDRRIQRAM